MKLLTKELATQIPKLYQTERVPLPEKLVYAKLFHPASKWTWYVIEYDGNDLCFGLVEGEATEFGYFSLSELSQPMGSWKLPAERDLFFRPTMLQDLNIFSLPGMVA